VLECKGADSNSCLTAPQVTALKTLYSTSYTKEGKTVNPGEMPGAELDNGGWEPWITGKSPRESALWGFVTGYFDDMVYDKAGLDVQTLDPDAAFDLAVQKTAGDLDAVNPDLSAFSARGGKLILYHGWNDPAIPALGTIDYFSSVAAAAGEEKASTFTRLFLVPGMQHCSGGPGITSFGQGGPSLETAGDNPQDSIYRALEAWVEAGKAPEKIVASGAVTPTGKLSTSMTRPLCPYPQTATYSGSGNRKRATSWVCTVAK
jgi:feruloyl esterase